MLEMPLIVILINLVHTLWANRAAVKQYTSNCTTCMLFENESCAYWTNGSEFLSSHKRFWVTVRVSSVNIRVRMPVLENCMGRMPAHNGWKE